MQKRILQGADNCRRYRRARFDKRGISRKREKYLKEYRENCAVIGEEISIERGEEIKKGRAVEIAENFGLEVSFENGEREVITGGEVSVKGFYPANNTGRE